MGDRYTTTLDVSAWRYDGGGVIPDGAREMFASRQIDVWHRVYPYHMHEITRAVIAEHGGWQPPEEGTPIDALFWYSDTSHECHAGDWIVSHEYGVEAVADAWFREAYRPAGEGGDA